MAASRTGPELRLDRRQLLRAVSFSSAGITLPLVFRQRAQAASRASQRRAAAVIFIQLGGGASQFETYDPKPDAPSEYRGASKAISTQVPGVLLSELFPEQARRMDRLAVVRSVHHEEASHIALHLIETGYLLRDPKNSPRGEMPSMGSIVARVRGEAAGGMPAFFSLPKPHAYSNPQYLGGRYDSFNIDADPSAGDFRVQNLSLDAHLTADRLGDRRQLWQRLNDSRRLVDTQGNAAALDAFTQQAFDMLLGDRAQRALDLGREDPRVRQQYGHNPFGQRLLLARRLIEAEVPFVVVRTFDWDDHDKLAMRMGKRAPDFDRGIAALVDDLHARGMQQDVLLVAMGEFGRTPRVNRHGGRDHWPGVMSALVAGGSYRMGQAIGASDIKGAAPAAAPYRPENVLAMAYHHLGIDPSTTFRDLGGRPRYILERRELISELLT